MKKRFVNRSLCAIALSLSAVMVLGGCGAATSTQEVENTKKIEETADMNTSDNDNTAEIIPEEEVEIETTPEPTEAPTATPAPWEGLYTFWEYENVDISWIDPEKPMVAFTFDDGPISTVSETSTASRIQNALSENGQHATFFYWGATFSSITQAEVERAFELGFEIGNHTKSHLNLSDLSDEEIEKEVSYMNDKLSAITGQENHLVRPPYLSADEDVKNTVKAPLIGCGIDTKDWDGASAESIIDTITSAMDKGTLDGQIILMHETYQTTAEAVEYLVPYLVEQGYQIVSVSELYLVREKKIRSGNVYTSCSK